MQLIEKACSQKLRGAYYTPPVIARFLLQWAMQGRIDADILEPSCGDGVFLEQMVRCQMRFRHLTAVEFIKTEADKAREIGLSNAEVVHADFHRFCLDAKRRYDVVVGNPPFIRYQYYDAGQQKLADKIFGRAGLKRSKLMNAWVTFVIGSCLLLRERGKLGFVVPSELLQVSYARQLRQFLASSFNRINIISFRNLVFDDIQQEVVLLLCEKSADGNHNIEHIEVKDADDLSTLDPQRLNLPSKEVDFHADKWNYYFLDVEEIDFLRRIRLPGMPKIGDYADVEVGITTGANGYFTVPQSVVDLYQLHDYARPMVGRSVQVNSICFTKGDWTANCDSDAKANLLVFPKNAATEGNDGVKAYIRNGEQQGVNKGYKTSIRDEWYVIPSVRCSDALFLRRNNIYPKFVLNAADAYTTDTMHRVFVRKGVNKKALIASYYNSLSFAFAEITGRCFGGGVLELMPSEVEDIYLPYREANEFLFVQLDRMMREKRTPDEILDVSDDLILRRGMNFSQCEVRMARTIWHKLMGRRVNRELHVRAARRGDAVENAVRLVAKKSEHSIICPAYRNRPQQLRLALEKKRGQKTGSGTKGKTAAKPKSVKSRYMRKPANG